MQPHSTTGPVATRPIDVTEVHIHVSKNRTPENPLVGFAKIVLNGAFAVNGIRIVKGNQGLFVSFPREMDKVKNKTYNTCFPIRADLNEQITAAVLEAFAAALLEDAKTNERTNERTYSDADRY